MINGGTMAATALFISYAHKDMTPINWLERLKLYLAPLRRHEVVDDWDDTQINVGSEWRVQIQGALDRAAAAILLVGPGFMASDFVAREELPSLLKTMKERGLRIYPVVVGYCSYKKSVLEPYQSFNDPDHPLEALQSPEQNRILNELCLAVDRDMQRSKSTSGVGTAVTAATPRSSMERIRKHLSDTRTAFVAQCNRRDELVARMRKRLKVQEMSEYEIFFVRHYPNLTADEKFHFEQIRAMTEGPLYQGNKAILEILESNPGLMEEAPALASLRQHLVFWLNKYDRVFSKRSDMCLLYVGVEDGVPFPSRVDTDIDNWLKKK